MNQIKQAGLQRALLSDAPAADRIDKMSLYGWMIGDWEMDYTYHLPDGSKRTGTGSIHSGWALQGRAIQDVWRIPGPNPDGPDDPAKSVMYGTTNVSGGTVSPSRCSGCFVRRTVNGNTGRRRSVSMITASR